MRTGPKLALHIIPISAFNHNEVLDPTKYRHTSQTLPISHSESGDYFLNIDGLVTTNSNPTNIYSYMQSFRNGIIEACDSGLFNTEHKIIQFDVGNKLIQAIDNYLKIYRENQMAGPIVIYINLLNAKRL